MSKRFGGNIGYRDKTSSWHLIGFPNGSNIVSTVYVAEKPTVISYTYINRHAGTPDKNKDEGQDEPGYSSIFSIGSRIV